MLLEFATASQGVAIETHVISDREQYIMDVKAKHHSLFLEMLLDGSEHECYTKLCCIKTLYTFVVHLPAFYRAGQGYMSLLCFLQESCIKTGLVLETFFPYYHNFMHICNALCLSYTRITVLNYNNPL